MLRFFIILWLAARFRLDELLLPLPLPRLIRILLLLSPLRLIPRHEATAVRLRKALEHIGPIGIKFGQALSTRRDLLPADLADELSRLQEHAPPFSVAEVSAIIVSELGKPPEQLFRHFDQTPLAAASVAQVHGAILNDGSEVIVKILRPNIRTLVERDLNLLHTAASLIEKLIAGTRLIKPVQVVEEYRQAVRSELDLRIEAANTALLGRHFRDSQLLYVPKIHWDYCTLSVMVAERIHGVPVDHVEKMQELGVDFQCLAERGLEIFFTQVFENNYFHADMHPGNIYVDVSDPAYPSYFALDCAVMGSLTEADLYYLARNLLAIFQQNYRLVAELHIECGWVAPDVSVTALEEAVRTVCEPVFNRPLEEISFGHLLVDLFATARRFKAEVQPSLIMLQKTLLQVEGLGRRLYPQLDLWAIGRPFLTKWVRKRYSPIGLYRQIKDRIPGWLEQMPQMPDKLLQAIEAVAQQPQPPARSDSRHSRRRRPGCSTLLWLIIAALVGAVLLPL